MKSGVDFGFMGEGGKRKEKKGRKMVRCTDWKPLVDESPLMLEVKEE